MRIECKQGSALPAKLIELGYSPRHCGTGTRLTSGHTPETIFLPIDILEITLPGSDAMALNSLGGEKAQQPAVVFNVILTMQCFP